MAIRVIKPLSSSLPSVDGIPCRAEEIALRLVDGTVWVLDRLLVPQGAKSISLRAAAYSLKRDREQMARGRQVNWRLVHPKRLDQVASV